MAENNPQIGQLERVLNTEVDSTNMNRRKFMEFLGLAGAAATIPGVANAGSREIEWKHPFYEVMFNGANSEGLKTAILNENLNNSRRALVALLPDYRPRNMGSYTTDNMRPDEVGGDNAIYWACLRLVCNQIRGKYGTYEGILKYHNPANDPKLPTGVVLDFAKSIIPAKNEDMIMNELDQLPRFAALFNYDSNKRA